MERQGKTWIIVFVVSLLLAIVLGVFFAFKTYGPIKNTGTGEIETSGINREGFVTETPQALPTVEGGTRSTIVESQVIPTPEVTKATASTTQTPKNVAIPEYISAPSKVFGGSQVQGALRDFKISLDDGAMSPSTVVVNEKDVVNLNFTAVDGDYIISLSDFGIVRTIAKSKTVQVQFQASPFGKFSVMCKNCGSGTVLGSLIVNKQ